MGDIGLAIFDRKKTQAGHFKEAWEAVDQEIDGKLRPRYESQPDNDVLRGAAERLQADRRELSERLRVALERLLDRLEYPVLTFATTGTTSSGKSALVNLLCGAEIMPVAHEETSAGVVTITHGPSRTLTVFPPAEGTVPWQHDCGTFPGQTDAQICQRLTCVMKTYNDYRNRLRLERIKPEEMPPCPISELEYPTRIGSQPELLGLPSRCRFRVMDLPGLNDTKDEGNRRIIRERAREAICLVAYNCDEPNKKLQEELLGEVVSQVRELGGSPARMLFILNRIDAIWRDSTRELAKQAEDEFAARIEGRIKEMLEENLDEYAEAIGNLEVVRLCTLPALLGNLLRYATGPERQGERLYAADRLSEKWREFVPRSVWKSIQYREPEDWTEETFRAVGEAASQTSYGDTFFARLRAHIDEHFPDLVIPQEVDRFKVDAASRIVEWVVQTVDAELNNSDERYDQELKRIRRIRNELSELCRSSQRQLTEPFDAIGKLLSSQQSPSMHEVEQILNSLHDKPLFLELYSAGEGGDKPLLEAGSLRPLINWRRGIAQALQSAFEVIGNVLIGRRDTSPEKINRLEAKHYYDINVAYHDMQNAGYSNDMAQHGKEVETNSNYEKARLVRIQEALDKLSGVLDPVMSSVMNGAAQLEMDRIFEATRRMLDAYWR